MAETAVINVENNGYRNVVIRATFVSVDGTGITNQVLYNATSSGTYGVLKAGQTFYPGVHTTIVGLDYDVQDTKVRLQWEATANADILALGNAPEDFRWERFGGIRVPSGLTGATGSILLSTVNTAPQSTFTIILYIRKNVPVS